jgi:hypothetical protein
MNRITVTVFKTPLTKEADINKIARRIMKQQRVKYREAYPLAEKEFDPVQYTQIIHSDSKELDLRSLGAHIANGAQFRIARS